MEYRNKLKKIETAKKMMLSIKHKTLGVSKVFIGVVAISTALSSCGVIKPYEAPVTPTADYYRDALTNDTISMGALPWREIFTDAPLQTLIQAGIDNNLDLLSTLSKVKIAQSYYLQSKAALLPSLNLNAQVDHSNDTQYQLGFTTAWELDIWGKLSSTKRASLASLLQTEAGARAVQTSLVATIANYYYQLLSLDKQLRITEQTVENWKSTVITMKALKEAGRVTEAAVVQSEAQQFGAAVTIPDLKQSIKEFENALSVLVGKTPGSVQRSTFDEQQVFQNLHTGLPAQLLANRPDVQQAELNLRQHFELTNVARAYFYPSLSITGAAGQYASSLETLFDPSSSLARITAGLLQPIFSKRANKTRLEVANAEQHEALYEFQFTLLTAGQEVSDALSLYQTADEKKAVRANQLDALGKSVEYSQELLENGFANYTEVITARQSLLQAELSSVNDGLQQFNAVVDLYRSLGGGWK